MTTPRATGGDLYHLWRVSEVHLPRVADAFYDASRLLAGGRGVGGDTDDGAFRAGTSSYPGIPASGFYSGTGRAWDALRDELQRGLAQVGDTILEAAAAVRRATADYLEVDGEASRNLLNVYLADPNNHNPDP